MNINSNVIRWGVPLIGALAVAVAVGVQRLVDESKDHHDETATTKPVPAAQPDKMTVEGTPTPKTSRRTSSSSMPSGLWDSNGLDIAGHKSIFYLSEGHEMTTLRIKAMQRIHEQEYAEAALHLRNALERGLEAVIAHNLGDGAIRNSGCENIRACETILDPELIDRLQRTRILLNGNVHCEEAYRNMSRERIMAAVNTVETLERLIKGYGQSGKTDRN